MIQDTSQENTVGLVRFTIFTQPISEHQASRVPPYYLLSHLAISTNLLSVLYLWFFLSKYLPYNGCLLRNHSFQSSDLDSRTKSPLGSLSFSFRVRPCQCLAQGRPILRNCRLKDVLVPGSHWLGHRNTLASARTWKWENHCHVQCL